MVSPDDFSPVIRLFGCFRIFRLIKERHDHKMAVACKGLWVVGHGLNVKGRSLTGGNPGRDQGRATAHQRK
jgi:hypothetical protein